ncbi:hypothetical protein WDZ92_35015, partial [Nostoc sp. NIES-2111]
MSDRAEASAKGNGSTPRQHFTTEALPAAHRLAIWREEFGRTLLHADIEPASDEPLHAEATMSVLPGARSLEFRGSAMCFARRKEILASSDDTIGLVISREGDLGISQRKQDASLQFGDACLILSHEPGMITSRGHLGLLFPSAPLTERVRTIEDYATKSVARDTESLRLLQNYLSAMQSSPPFLSSKLSHVVAEHIYDLLVLVICPNHSINENSLSATAAARLETAIAYIATHFDRPNLTISAVARDQNVSPRFLQRLSGTTGSTFSQRAQEVRLRFASWLFPIQGQEKVRF